jgi:CBS domain containing-hemolysin-like protein
LLLIVLFFLSIFFLVGSFFLTAEISSLNTLSKKDAVEELKADTKLFYYRLFHIKIFPEKKFEGLFFSSVVAQNFAKFCFAACSTLFITQTEMYRDLFFESYENSLIQWFWLLLIFITLILFSFLIGDYFPRLFGTRSPKVALKLSGPINTIFQFMVFPITYVFLKLRESISHAVYLDHSHKPSSQVKQEIIEIIEGASLGPTIDIHDKKLIEAVLSFRERIAREVMVPRVDLFCLPAETSIKEAAKILQTQGYSRTPVYKNTVDNIVGVLMYKDLLSKYMEYEREGNDPKILEAPIESIQKNILYTPETKKLSNLLQEFRKKQVHLAIVVDEYGGTEGIVTIEDILEEIVGDISDEYDNEEELYRTMPDGSWIVDARMNILDIEEQMDINIPQESDYDTLGGYIYQIAGTIPTRGFVIHHDNFELEVLSCTDRVVEKVRIRRTE